MGFDFIVIVPFLPSHCSFSFVFGCGVSFLVSSSVFLSLIVQQLVVIPVLSQEGVSTCPSTPPSWTNLDLPKSWRFPQLKKCLEEWPQFWNKDEMKTSGDRPRWGDGKGGESANMKKKKGAWGYFSQCEGTALHPLTSPCLQLRDGTHLAKPQAPCLTLHHQCCRTGFHRGEFEMKNWLNLPQGSRGWRIELLSPSHH